MSRDRNDHYIPEKRDWRSSENKLIDVTSDDIKDAIIVDEGIAGVGRTTVRRGIAFGLKDELNRDSATQFWVDYSDTVEDGAHWSSFNGHHICVDVDIRQYNEREVNDWKGRDEVRGRTYAKILFNKEPVYEISWGTIAGILVKLQVVIPELLNLPALTEYLRSKTLKNEEGESLIGRKVYYREHPGVITRFLGDQGCVIIEADPWPWPTPVWAAGDEDIYENDDDIKDDILSPHIWWFRD